MLFRSRRAAQPPPRSGQLQTPTRVIAAAPFEVRQTQRVAHPLQQILLEDIIDIDTSAIEQEWADQIKDELITISNKPKAQPKCVALPPELPRTKIRHEPNNTQCQCGCQIKRIGEEVKEKLDYTPGVFSAEQHIRGNAPNVKHWARRRYQRM